MSESSDLKALKYAEEQLRVHECYSDAQAARIRLDGIVHNLVELRNKKRDLALRMSDKEMEVASDEWAKHPDMSAARMEKHIKVAYSNDGEIRGYREELAMISGQIDLLEYEERIAETDIKIAVARMEQLGGYLQFLAAIKASRKASEVREAEKPKEEGNPW